MKKAIPTLVFANILKSIKGNDGECFPFYPLECSNLFILVKEVCNSADRQNRSPTLMPKFFYVVNHDDIDLFAPPFGVTAFITQIAHQRVNCSIELSDLCRSRL